MAKVYKTVATCQVSVDSTYIHSVVNNITDHVSQMGACIGAMEKMISSELQEAWQGEARMAFDTSVASTITTLKAFLEDCDGLVATLQTNANTYETAMNRAMQLASEIK